MGAHAKPLTRKQLQKRRRRTKWLVSSIGLALIASLGVGSAAMGMQRNSSLLQATENPNPGIRRVTDGNAADRNSYRNGIPTGLDENQPSAVVSAEESRKVQSTINSGKWLPLEEMDADSLTKPSKETSDKEAEEAKKRATGKAENVGNNDADAADTDSKSEAERDGSSHANDYSTDAGEPLLIPESEGTRANYQVVTAGDVGNAYPYGQCTWWAYERRHQLGKFSGSHFGDAKSWASSASALGYPVDNTPMQQGDILVFMPGQEGAHGYYGHVAVVEQVNPDGSILISESNVRGLGTVTNRVFTAEQAKTFHYIH